MNAMDTSSQFQQLQQLQRADHDTMVRVETKMDSLTDEIKRNNTDLMGRISDHEARIRILEKDDGANKGKMSATSRNITILLSLSNLLLWAAAIYVGTHH